MIPVMISWPRHNSCRKAVGRNAHFPHGCLDVSKMSWDKIKSPYLCRNCTFPNSMHHRGMASIRLQAECFPGFDDAPSWEMCDFRTGMGFCYMIQGWITGYLGAILPDWAGFLGRSTNMTADHTSYSDTAKNILCYSNRTSPCQFCILGC